MKTIIKEIHKLRSEYIYEHHKLPTRVLIDSKSLSMYLAYSYGSPYTILGMEIFVKYLPYDNNEKYLVVE